MRVIGPCEDRIGGHATAIMPGMSWQKPGRLHLVTLNHEIGPDRKYLRDRDDDGNTVWYPVSEPGRKVHRDQPIRPADLAAEITAAVEAD
jgi:hypothetical protein